MKPSLVLFLHDHRYDRLSQAISMLLTASSMGWTSHLFLFHGALASYTEGTWDDVNIVPPGKTDHHLPPWAKRLQEGCEQRNLPSLYEMLEKARGESGGVHVCACSASCRVLGLDLDEVRKKVDEIVGLPTMMQIAEKSRHVMYI